MSKFWRIYVDRGRRDLGEGPFGSHAGAVNFAKNEVGVAWVVRQDGAAPKPTDTHWPSGIDLVIERRRTRNRKTTRESALRHLNKAIREISASLARTRKLKDQALALQQLGEVRNETSARAASQVLGQVYSDATKAYGYTPLALAVSDLWKASREAETPQSTGAQIMYGIILAEAKTKK